MDADDENIVKYLHGKETIQADERYGGLTAIRYAWYKLEHGFPSYVATTLIQNADINIRKNKGQHLLFWSIEKIFFTTPTFGHLRTDSPAAMQHEILSLLLKRNESDMNQEDHRARSALHLVIEIGKSTDVGELLD